MKKLAIFLFALLIATFLRFHHVEGALLEKDYQKEWCTQAGGVTEFVLDDKTRVDCLTDKYAIEFDYGHKWAEAIGQSVYYAIKTDRLPGVVLIVGPNDEKYVKRLRAVAEKTWIKVWTMPK